MIGHIYTCAFVGSSYKYIMLFNAWTWKTQNWILSLLELMFVWQIFIWNIGPFTFYFYHARENLCLFIECSVIACI